MKAVLVIALGLVLLAPACNKNAPEASTADEAAAAEPAAEAEPDLAADIMGDEGGGGEEGDDLLE